MTNVTSSTTTQSPPALGATPAPRPQRRRGRHARQVLSSTLLHALLCIGLAAALLPFAWMLLGSLKTQGELLQRPITWLPRTVTWDHYISWFTDLHIGVFFANSLIVAAVTVVGNLLFCSLVGYALAKMDFAGKRVLFALVLITLMVPGVVTFVPLFVTVSKLGLVNTIPAMFLPFLVTPLGVFLMRQFMLGIPDSLIEAAQLDGAGQLRTFLRVVLPLSGAPLATLGILTFLSSWNNFLWPLVVAQSQDKYTLPVALSLYSTGQNVTDYGLLMAGSVLVIAPILVLFLFLQKYFTVSIATTGIK
jgi:multiple sugar transport system permease protein